MKKQFLILILFGLIFMGSSVFSAEIKKNKTLAPYFFIKNGDPAIDFLPLKSTNVEVNISGVIAEVIITQQYKNKGTRAINARYIFPASTQAAVFGMKMIIGDKIIKAKIMEKKKAKVTFEKAKKIGKSASLLQQQRPNVFSMDVANIMPGDNILVKLSYTELLIPQNNKYEFIFPTLVGPRYSNISEKSALENERWISNPYLKKKKDSVSENSSESKSEQMIFNIITRINTSIPIKELTSPSHKIDINWQNQSQAEISLINKKETSPDRDYIIKYCLAGDKILSGLMLHKGKKENFFLLMIQPPKQIKTDNIPPREYIFVVDVSGSMSGFPLDISKELLNNLVKNLRQIDTFNVLLFAGSSRLLSSQSINATPGNISKAIDFINKPQGGGGTELLRAIKRAIKLPHGENSSRSIVVVTDGYVSFEKNIFYYIRNNLNRTNIFAFGIGSSVNRYLIEGIAKAGYGEPFIITKPFFAKKQAEIFRKYINSPILTNISIEYDSFSSYEIEPSSIQDLFANRPVIVFGKWKGDSEGNIIIKGSNGEGLYEKNFDISKIKISKSNASLKYLWARTRLSNLSDYNFSPNSDRKEEITSLGLKYNLLTKYTSFVAVYEKIRNKTGDSTNVKQPLPLPEGVSNKAISNPISKTPEPELYLILGMFLLFLLLYSVYKKK